MVARVVSGVVVWTIVSGFTAVEAATSSTHHSADDIARVENCGSCHQFPATRTHVVGVRPTFDVPAEYPLGPNREVTCLTCHEVKAGVANGAYLVRGGLQGEAFCRSCHAPRGQEESRLGHAVRAGAAHMPRVVENPDRMSKAPASVACQACHDGVIGQDGHWSVQEQIVPSRRDLGHPVGVDYPSAQIRSTTLNAVPMLNPAIGLEGGTVGCTSCHDALSRVPKQLVIDNRGSALCLACHRM